MKITPVKDLPAEQQPLLELTVDKPLPHPLDGKVSVYEETPASLIQVLVVDGVEEVSLITLDGEARVTYLLDIIEREGAEVLVANAYIDYEVETYGMFRGSARLAAYRTPAAERAMAQLSLTMNEEVLHELHNALTASGSVAYPLNPAG